ncbi:MAG: hypothetical protein ACOC95_06510 [Planctomycetota bacterium]
MKRSRIAVLVVLLAMAGSGYAQVTFNFDETDQDTVQKLADAGWILIDDQEHGDPPVQYLDTIQIETSTTHSGSGALRLGAYDIAYFPLNGEFGTLDLWVYDAGVPVEKFGGPVNCYGPRWGLRKFGDVDVSIYYPDNEPVDHGILEDRPYGVGAGLVNKSFLGSDGGYGVEWGATAHMDEAICSNANLDFDPENPAVNAGWAGDQSWWSPSYYGPYFGADGRPTGWFHWEIVYETPGQVTVNLLESPTGSTNTASEAGSHAFDGTTAGGVDDIYLYGGSTVIEGLEPELWYGDGIFDDVTWTPLDTGPALQADFDGDGDVDLDDFVILKTNFGVGTTHAEGDADGDGDVDLDDFVILKQEFGSTS